jgi:pimeloyl-ACP methyl ester carboxylesterase
VLFGTTEAGANCVLFAATYPGRVSGLILYGTQAKWTRSEDYPWALSRELWDVLFKRHTGNWGQPLNIEIYAPSRAQDPQLREWWAKALRTGSSPGAMKAVLEVMQDIDVRDILPAIRTPTLVLHRKCDRGVLSEMVATSPVRYPVPGTSSLRGRITSGGSEIPNPS